MFQLETGNEWPLLEDETNGAEARASSAVEQWGWNEVDWRERPQTTIPKNFYEEDPCAAWNVYGRQNGNDWSSNSQDNPWAAWNAHGRQNGNDWSSNSQEEDSWAAWNVHGRQNGNDWSSNSQANWTQDPWHGRNGRNRRHGRNRSARSGRSRQKEEDSWAAWNVHGRQNGNDWSSNSQEDPWAAWNVHGRQNGNDWSSNAQEESQAMIQSLQQSLAAAEDKVSSLEKQKGELQAELDAAGAEISGQKGQLEEVETQLAAALAEVNRLKAEKEDLQQAMAVAEKQAEQRLLDAEVRNWYAEGRLRRQLADRTTPPAEEATTATTTVVAEVKEIARQMREEVLEELAKVSTQLQDLKLLSLDIRRDVEGRELVANLAQDHFFMPTGHMPEMPNGMWHYGFGDQVQEMPQNALGPDPGWPNEWEGQIWQPWQGRSSPDTTFWDDQQGPGLNPWAAEWNSNLE